MRQLMCLIFVLAFNSFAFANDFAVVVGAVTNSAEKVNTAQTGSISGQTGYQAGVLGFIDLANQFQFRGGFVYSQRIYTYEATGSPSTDLKLAYFDIPITAMWKFADYGGVFAGPVLAMNASKECSTNGCSTDGVKSSLIAYQFGASFKFAPQIGAQLYYEMIPGNIQEVSGAGVKDGKSVAVNALFTFE